MRLKLLFVIGLVAGYILGARAGRERYLQIKETATDAWENPRVQKAVADTQDFVNTNAPIVAEKVVEGAKAAADKVAEVAPVVAEKVTEKVAEGAKVVADGAKIAADGVKVAGDKVVESARIAGTSVAEGTQAAVAKVTGAGSDTAASHSDNSDAETATAAARAAADRVRKGDDTDNIDKA